MCVPSLFQTRKSMFELSHKSKGIVAVAVRPEVKPVYPRLLSGDLITVLLFAPKDLLTQRFENFK